VDKAVDSFGQGSCCIGHSYIGQNCRVYAKELKPDQP